MRLDPVSRLDSASEEGRPPSPPMPLSGMARFAPSGRGADAEREIRARRFLWTSAPAAAPEGQLRAAVDEAVELALAMRGALPPRAPAGAALDVVIADQVFRAMALGAAGLAVALPRLAGGARGALHPEDSATLLAWLNAAREAPVALLFDEADRSTQVLAPVPLAELVERRAPGEHSAVFPRAQAHGPAEREAERAASPARPTPPSAAAPASQEAPPADPRGSAPPAPPASGVSTTSPTSSDGRPRGVLPPRSARLRRPDAPAGVPSAGRAAGAPAPGSAAPSTMAEAFEAATASAEAVAPPEERGAGATERGAGATERGAGATLRPPRAHEPAAAAPPAEAAQADADLLPPTRKERRAPRNRILSAAEWRSLAVELDNARGPKPVKVIEQLFATHYTPLLGATLAGETDAAVRGVVDSWRTSFEHSYREAFSALRVTGKRPPMVFDAPEIAGRIARLNGARGVKLLLVDAMRFDLGERVAAHLKEIMMDRAILVERSLLWAALPPTTTTQIALLARGQDGLRDATPPVESEPAIARGRAVATLRRERVGSRELMKLDLVEARLRAAGPPFAERIEAIAEEVADVVARFMDSLPPRTLLLVFGDHGFRVTPMGDGSTTGPASQGGGSPEEVLVPAQAWLVGGVH
ncbi:hypothetical protein SOCE26_089810 [Sorangium cellulosum]|uniref:Uncharacterized protein n=1 Tax=Sorangium cellulosum TaxID=56 RepID=A0A2L0F7D0_SORCE|nr:hypothetical protein [Sorangium cellulosum]AUX47460.1 hypothetical protein SOCE26_089810 [Sorangium cellulosum]